MSTAVAFRQRFHYIHQFDSQRLLTGLGPTSKLQGDNWSCSVTELIACRRSPQATVLFMTSVTGLSGPNSII